MCKRMTANALRLKEYIDTIDNFDFIEPEVCPYRDHIGALFTDAILQAGVNYRSVVRPRVESVLMRFPEADTVTAFSKVLNRYGVREVLHWNNTAKIHRMEDLVSFCSFHSIDTAEDLTYFLNSELGEEQLKEINGIGNKTCEYSAFWGLIQWQLTAIYASSFWMLILCLMTILKLKRWLNLLLI